MTSIKTNPAAMIALRTLNATNTALQQTQNRVSTGYRVSEAADNAAYWSIATIMRSDSKALSTVQDALGLGTAKIDVTYMSLNSTIEVVDNIKSKLVAAREPGVDKASIQSEIVELQAQLRAIADSASFSGENWLSVDSSAANYVQVKEVVSSFTRAGTGVTVNTIQIDTANIELFDDADQSGLMDSTFTTTGAGALSVSVHTLDITAAGMDNTDLDDMISAVDAAHVSLTSAAADLGATKSRISMQRDFVNTLLDAVERGIGTLVDADMTEESTRLQALQTQQQLGIQALSIANSSAQSILSLFQ
ncbi:MAG: flagellin [Phyllobacteriaceae bacterium]|uniref:flagellin N-terminal helical domain-containing protein n=1 Tax=Zhengella sedimenti TaxID=3390035 RepID=UPI000C4A636C|nr:flagellin [Phyllobacteriaceae bacterium]MBA93203.1 flagellin [Phyllobacteriaceae bacterium]